MNEIVDIAKLTPHAGSMLLLDRMLDAGNDHFVSKLTVRADGLFDSEGTVPSYLGLEYMAQTVAAFSGYESYLRGNPVKPGFLLGTRRFNTNVSRMTCGEELTVLVKRQVQAVSGLASFECEVRGKDIRQAATLSVYEPPNAAEYAKGTSGD